MTPDYFQRNSRFGGFEGKGQAFCGPTAASNGIFWLGYMGYPRLLDTSLCTFKSQFDLIQLLGSSQFMNTGSEGSSPQQVCKGLSKFFKSKNYLNTLIQFHGWRKISKEFSSGLDKPTIETLQQALNDSSFCLINIGWYSHDSEKRNLTRNGGHWVTLVDLKIINHDTIELSFHDPETKNRFTDTNRCYKLVDGKLKGDLHGLPRSAKDYFYFKITPNESGLIEGAVIVSLPQKEKLPTAISYVLD